MPAPSNKTDGKWTERHHIGAHGRSELLRLRPVFCVDPDIVLGQVAGEDLD